MNPSTWYATPSHIHRHTLLMLEADAVSVQVQFHPFAWAEKERFLFSGSRIIWIGTLQSRVLFFGNFKSTKYSLFLVNLCSIIIISQDPMVRHFIGWPMLIVDPIFNAPFQLRDWLPFDPHGRFHCCKLMASIAIATVVRRWWWSWSAQSKEGWIHMMLLLLKVQDRKCHQEWQWHQAQGQYLYCHLRQRWHDWLTDWLTALSPRIVRSGSYSACTVPVCRFFSIHVMVNGEWNKMDPKIGMRPQGRKVSKWGNMLVSVVKQSDDKKFDHSYHIQSFFSVFTHAAQYVVRT